jgi:hypothetical protein
MSNDENLPMVNHNGREYTMQDFEDAQDADLESLKFYRPDVEPEMEILIAADYLCRVLCGTHKGHQGCERFPETSRTLCTIGDQPFFVSCKTRFIRRPGDGQRRTSALGSPIPRTFFFLAALSLSSVASKEPTKRLLRSRTGRRG